MTPMRPVGGARAADLTPDHETQAAPAAAPSATAASAPARGAAPGGRMAAAAAVTTAAPAAPIALPAWYPASFDMKAAAAGAKSILEAQGEKPETIGPGKADKIVFTDADHTLLQTNTPTLLKSKTTGEFLKHPGTGRILLLGVGTERDAAKELAALKTKYPQVKWDDYGMDYREFGSVSEIMRTKEIRSATGELRRSDRDPKSRDFIITARSDDMVPAGLDEYLAARGIDINGVFAVNNPGQGAKMGTTAPGVTLSSAQKKAVSMAALLTLYEPGGAEVKKVRFLDDTDSNLVAAMELLPKLFPKTKFEFVDVVHQPNGSYKQVVVGKANERGAPAGEVRDAKGKAMSAADIAGYKSVDAPWHDDVAFEGHPK